MDDRLDCGPGNRYELELENMGAESERGSALINCARMQRKHFHSAGCSDATDKSPQQARTLKPALDVHLHRHVVAMQYNGEFPKPPQRFTPLGLLVRVQKQIARGWRVISCSESFV